MKPVNGKVVLVTGASSGLGHELVHQLLEKGAIVAATFRKQQEVDFFNSKHPAQGLGVLADVTDEVAVQAGVAQVLARFGRIDIVANCAGAGTVGAARRSRCHCCMASRSCSCRRRPSDTLPLPAVCAARTWAGVR